jgi:hypothetical protein
MRAFIVLTVLLTVMLPVLGNAQAPETDVLVNHVSDPGFDSFPGAAWTVFDDPMAQDATFGRSNSTSARCEFLGYTQTNCTIKQCVDAIPADTKTYTLGFFFYHDSSNFSYCDLWASGYTSNDCSGDPTPLFDGSPTFSSATINTWHNLEASFDNAGYESVTITLRCIDYSRGVVEAPTAVWMDDAYLGESPVFFDGFETGNTSGWSSSVR